MKNMNFAIVGFGGIGRTHAMGAYCANLQLSLPYLLNLKTIVSRKPIMEKIPPCAANSLNIEEVLQDQSIDFIDICTPNESHKEMVLHALKYKLPIYCEKPLASNYKEALEMTEAVEKAGVKNAVALMYRYMPALRLVKGEIEKSSIGEVIDFKINLYHKSYLDSKKKGTWRTGEASGGGALMDLGVHLIDAIHFTLGDIETVDCKNRVYFKDRTSVDEIAECKFELFNKMKGTLEVSRIFAEKKDSTTYTIYGTKGSIKLNSSTPYSIEIYSFEDNRILIKNASEVAGILNLYPGERSSMGYHLDGHMASLAQFSNSIFTNSENSIVPTFRDGLKAQRVIEAAYMSDREERKVHIEEI